MIEINQYLSGLSVVVGTETASEGTEKLVETTESDPGDDLFDGGESQKPVVASDVSDFTCVLASVDLSGTMQGREMDIWQRVRGNKLECLSQRMLAVSLMEVSQKVIRVTFVKELFLLVEVEIVTKEELTRRVPYLFQFSLAIEVIAKFFYLKTFQTLKWIKE